MVEVSDFKASCRIVEVVGDVNEEIAAEGIFYVNDSCDENFIIDGHGELKGVFSVGVPLLDLVFVPLASRAAWVVVDHEVSAAGNVTGILEWGAEFHRFSTGEESKVSVAEDVPSASSVHVNDILPVIRRLSAFDFSGDFESW